MLGLFSKYYKYLFFLTFFFVGLSVAYAQQVVDLECIRNQIIDPTHVCDREFDISARDATGQIQPPDICVPGCNLLTESCYEVTANPALGVPPFIACFIDKDPTFANCGGPCDAALGEECILLNPIQSAPFISSPQSPLWKCINPDVASLNVFGANVGPAEIFIPRLIRTILTVVFVIIGLILFYQLFSSIFSYTQSHDPGEIEQVQKKIVGVVIGLFFIISAIVIVRLISLSFGIGGDIFDFTYP